jgi:hypothetical protein
MSVCRRAQTGMILGSELEDTGHYVMVKQSSMWIAENSDCIHTVKPLAQSSRSRSIGNELDECGPSIEIKKRHNANVCKITKINEFVFT